MEQSQYITTLQWAKITVGSWQQKQRKLRIGKSFDLMQSFEDHVTGAAGGDVSKIEFLYSLYGMFVDMGVGKGTPGSEVGENAASRRLVGKVRGNARRPKRWYSKAMAFHTKRLAEILAKHYGDQAVHTFSENLPNQIDIF